MGEVGRFLRNDLRYLMTNVAYAVATLGIDRMATVLIGSGAGNPPRESALRAMLNGIVDALKRLEPGERLQQVMLVEYNKAHYEEIRALLEKFAAEGSISDLALEVSSRQLPPSRRRRRPASRFWSRGQAGGPTSTMGKLRPDWCGRMKKRETTLHGHVRDDDHGAKASAGGGVSPDQAVSVCGVLRIADADRACGRRPMYGGRGSGNPPAG
jgi:hypothetical protein